MKYDIEKILEMYEDDYTPSAKVPGPRNMKLAEVPRSEMDNFNTPDLEQSPDSFLRPGETLEDFDVTFRRPNAEGGRIGFYKGESVVKSHGQQIKELTEAGESSVSIAKKLGLKQQTVNGAMDAMDKGIAGKEFKLNKPRSEIIKLAVNETGVNLKDPKHLEEVIQWIDDNPKANQKDAIKIFGKRKAQLVNSKFYGSPGKKWNDEKVKLKNKARLELTKLRSSPSLEAELGAPKKSGLNFHHAGFKESLTDLKNTMYIPGSPNRKMAKLFEDPLLKEMEAFTKVFDDVDASPLEKQKAATNYLKNDRSLRKKYPQFKDFKTRLSFKRTALDPSGIMVKEKLPDPSLAISQEPGMTLKGETPSTPKGKEILKKGKQSLEKVKGLIPFMKDLGIKCQLSKGINCMNPQAYEKSLNELSEKAAQGDQVAKNKLGKFTSKVATSGRVIKNALGPLAIASEVAIEGGIALNKTLETGVPFKQALGESYINKYLLGPKTQIDVEAERAKEFAKGEDFAMAERGRRMAPFMAQSATADAQRLKDRMKQMEEVKTYENFKPNYGFTKEEFEDTMRKTGSLKENEVYRDDFYKQQVEKPIEFKQLMELPSFKGTQEEFMKGGIASLNVKK